MSARAASGARGPWRPRAATFAFPGANSEPAAAPALPTSLRIEIAKFAAAGVVALLVVAAIAALVLRHLGTREALADATVLSRSVGRSVVEPVLTGAALDGDPAALAAVEEALHGWLNGGPIVAAKLWSAEGRLLLATGPVEEEADGDSAALALWADGADQGEYEPGREVLVRRGEETAEVYQRVHSPDGREAMLELYIADSTIGAGSRRVWLVFAPALLLGLIVLEVVQLPIAWALGHRVRRAELERLRMARRAVESAESERRRIAAFIHDRVIHNLAGRGLDLEAAARQAEREGQSATAAAVSGAATATRQSVRELRTLLGEIYPPGLRTLGLEAALGGLLAPLRAAGIEANLSGTPGAVTGEAAQALVYRVTKEAAENVLRHARARNVLVSLAVAGPVAVLTIEDDGRGFSPARPTEDHERHFGLRLLADIVTEAGGWLNVESGDGSGTRIRAEVLNE